MARQKFKAGNMLYPLPVVMISARDKDEKDNIITVAWAGTICSDPPMLSISVRPERYSYNMIKESGEFVVNLTTEDLAYATDLCGVKSGRDIDKFKECKLTRIYGDVVKAPMIKESPVNIECRVKDIMELGTHHMFIAEVVGVHVDDAYMNDNNKFCLEDAKPIVYSHGTYLKTGEAIGTFGYSVKKNEKK